MSSDRHSSREHGAATGGLIVVGLGASAGGLKALVALFQSLEAADRMAFVVIVHLSPEHESQMAELLQQHTDMRVEQVNEPVELTAGHVYVIPPGKNLSIVDGQLRPSRRSQNHTPIDHFFSTLAETHGHHAVGIVLSGTGSDGSMGLGHIKERGGFTLVQSPEEAEYDTMPRTAIATGHVDVVVPLAQMGSALEEYRQNVDRFTPTLLAESLSEEDRAVLAKIFAQLRTRTGHDFTSYKLPTVLRRITRRLHLSRSDSLMAYLEYLQADKDEVEHLLKDLLLTVTQFFRDPDAFAALKKHAISKVFEEKTRDEHVRAWVCGCASGEEAYSIAMLLFEEAERRSHLAAPQVFASDISDLALNVGREGRYPEAIASDVPGELLNRYFRREQNGYRVNNELREKTVFATHNLLQDPPFSRLDLITCRNVLIYLDRSIHRRIAEVFHYALRPGGYLFLGSAESIDAPDLFSTVDKRQGLYERRPGRPVIRAAISASPPQSRREPAAAPELDRDRDSLDLESLHRILLTPHAPPSLIVNADHQVVHTLGGGESYLKFTPGRPTQNVLKIVRSELRLELRTALYDAFRKAQPTRSRPIPVSVDGTPRHVELVVEPISESGFEGDFVHVLFREIEKSPEGTFEKTDGPGLDAEASGDKTIHPDGPRDDDRLIEKLESELDHVKKQLHTIAEEHDTASQEMTASNEEMRSMNEELRSTAEELETSQEELQSLNEELLALNEELESKIAEVDEVNSDLRNLMDATDIGTFFLDRRLVIKRFTPQVEALFDVDASDVGRPLSKIKHHLNIDDIASDASQALRDVATVEREVKHDAADKWFTVRYVPYHGVEGEIDGVVVTFVDTTDRRLYDQQLEALIDTLEELLTVRANQVKRLASELVLSEVQERKRIAHLLHDELQQLLYAFQLRVGALKSSLPTDLATRLANATELIDRAMEITRTLTVELSSQILEEEDVSAILQRLADRMKEMHGLKVSVSSSETVHMPLEIRTLLYQVARELLFNVVKHADAKQARMTLTNEATRFLLRVEDEGSGFDPAKMEKRKPTSASSFGIESVRERLHLFGGSLDIKTAPGEGTQATVSVPNAHDGAGDKKSADA